MHISERFAQRAQTQFETGLSPDKTPTFGIIGETRQRAVAFGAFVPAPLVLGNFRSPEEPSEPLVLTCLVAQDRNRNRNY